MNMLVTCLTLCDPMPCNQPGSSAHGILRKNTGVVAIPFSRGFSQPRDQTWVSCTAGRFFIIWATREAHIYVYMCVYIYTYTHINIYTIEYTHTERYTHTIEYYSAIKKNEIIPSATTWMGLEIIILVEVNQKRKTNTIWYHLYVESKTWYKLTYVWNKKRPTREQTCGGQGEAGWKRGRLGVWD